MDPDNSINSILNITYIISHDDKLHSIYKNEWTSFNIFLKEYNSLLDDVIKYNNKYLIIDFYKRAYNKCKTMRKITNDFNLTNNDENMFVKNEINKIIDEFIHIMHCNVQNI